jgi:uncharacterized membrane protein YccC
MHLTTVTHFRRGSWAWADSIATVAATTGPLLLLAVLDSRESGLVALCGGFAALYGLGEPLRRRASIVTAAGVGMTAVMVACSTVQSRPWAAGLVLALTAALATYLIDLKAAGQPGMIMFLVTGSVALGVPSTPGDVGLRALVTATGAVMALTVSLGLLALRPVDSGRLGTHPGAGSARNHAAWMAVATFVTAAVVIEAQVPHWQWAPISTAAVLQGTDMSTIFSRAVQRSAGTIVGVGITAVLLLTHPTFATTVLLCSACLGASQLLFPRNYALGITCVTPLAFLLPGVSHPIGDLSSLLQRVWSTAFGALLGVLMWYAAQRRRRRGGVPR